MDQQFSMATMQNLSLMRTRGIIKRPGECCDFELISEDNVRYPVHRCVVAAACRNMASTLVDLKLKTLKLIGVRSEHLTEIINCMYGHIYTGSKFEEICQRLSMHGFHDLVSRLQASHSKKDLVGSNNSASVIYNDKDSQLPKAQKNKPDIKEMTASKKRCHNGELMSSFDVKKLKLSEPTTGKMDDAAVNETDIGQRQTSGRIHEVVNVKPVSVTKESLHSVGCRKILPKVMPVPVDGQNTHIEPIVIDDCDPPKGVSLSPTAESPDTSKSVTSSEENLKKISSTSETAGSPEKNNSGKDHVCTRSSAQDISSDNSSNTRKNSPSPKKDLTEVTNKKTIESNQQPPSRHSSSFLSVNDILYSNSSTTCATAVTYTPSLSTQLMSSHCVRISNNQCTKVRDGNFSKSGICKSDTDSAHQKKLAKNSSENKNVAKLNTDSRDASSTCVSADRSIPTSVEESSDSSESVTLDISNVVFRSNEKPNPNRKTVSKASNNDTCISRPERHKEPSAVLKARQMAPCASQASISDSECESEITVMKLEPGTHINPESVHAPDARSHDILDTDILQRQMVAHSEQKETDVADVEKESKSGAENFMDKSTSDKDIMSLWYSTELDGSGNNNCSKEDVNLPSSDFENVWNAANSFTDTHPVGLVHVNTRAEKEQDAMCSDEEEEEEDIIVCQIMNDSLQMNLQDENEMHFQENEEVELQQNNQEMNSHDTQETGNQEETDTTCLNSQTVSSQGNEEVNSKNSQALDSHGKSQSPEHISRMEKRRGSRMRKSKQLAEVKLKAIQEHFLCDEDVSLKESSCTTEHNAVSGFEGGLASTCNVDKTKPKPQRPDREIFANSTSRASMPSSSVETFIVSPSSKSNKASTSVASVSKSMISSTAGAKCIINGEHPGTSDLSSPMIIPLQQCAIKQSPEGYVFIKQASIQNSRSCILVSPNGQSLPIMLGSMNSNIGVPLNNDVVQPSDNLGNSQQTLPIVHGSVASNTTVQKNTAIQNVNTPIPNNSQQALPIMLGSVTSNIPVQKNASIQNVSTLTPSNSQQALPIMLGPGASNIPVQKNASIQNVSTLTPPNNLQQALPIMLGSVASNIPVQKNASIQNVSTLTPNNLQQALPIMLGSGSSNIPVQKNSGFQNVSTLTANNPQQALPIILGSVASNIPVQQNAGIQNVSSLSPNNNSHQTFSIMLGQLGSVKSNIPVQQNTAVQNVSPLTPNNSQQALPQMPASNIPVQQNGGFQNVSSLITPLQMIVNKLHPVSNQSKFKNIVPKPLEPPSPTKPSPSKVKIPKTAGTEGKKTPGE